MNSKRIGAALLVVGMVGAAAWVQAGDLTPPPGPVTPMFRTLNELDPRIPIRQSDVPMVISEPGSYVLVEPLEPTAAGQVAITITTSNVTLDLNSLAIDGTGAFEFETGILMDGVFGTFGRSVIRNGEIRDCTGEGVNTLNATNMRIVDIRVYSSGSHGINVGRFSEVDRCNASGNGGFGFRGHDYVRFSECTAFGNTSDGFSLARDSKLVNCIADANDGNGITTEERASIEDTTATANALVGIVLQDNSIARGCVVRWNTGGGFTVHDAVMLKDCVATENGDFELIGGSGFFILGDGVTLNGCLAAENVGQGYRDSGMATYIDCSASFNGRTGFVVDDGGSLVNCSARGNGDAIKFPAGEGFRLGSNVSLKNCVATDNIDAGFFFESDAEGGMAESCHASGNGFYGFWFTNLTTLRGNSSTQHVNGFRGEGNFNVLIGNQAFNNFSAGIEFAAGAIENVIGQNVVSFDTFNIPAMNYVGTIDTDPSGANSLDDDPWTNVVRGN